jgi:hypothetical protein
VRKRLDLLARIEAGHAAEAERLDGVVGGTVFVDVVVIVELRLDSDTKGAGRDRGL